MNEEDHIGSRFIITLRGKEVTDSFITAISSYAISSVLVQSENISDKEQLLHLINDISRIIEEKVGKKPFIILNYTHECADITNSFMTPIPPPLALSATGDEGNAFSVGKLHALELRELGFDAIIGPSLELHTHTLHRDEDNMSFSDLNDIVSRFGIAMQNGYIEGGILPIISHFPGKSAIYQGEEESIGINDKTLEELQENELYPFERAIERDAQALLIAPYHYKAFSNEMMVASMSTHLIQDYLRDELNFKGLIIASEVDEKSISDYLPIEKVAVMSLLSGCDFIIISHRLDHIEKIYNSTQTSLSSGYLSREDHLWHTEHIEKIIKRGEKISFDKEAHTTIVNAIIERSITFLNSLDLELPPLGDNPIFLCKKREDGDGRESFASWMQKKLGGEAFEYTSSIENSEINHLIEEASDNTSIIIALKDGYAHPNELALANSLMATGIPTIAISLRDPYDALFLQSTIFTIAIYEETPTTFEGLRKVLSKERNATGNVSIHW